MPFSKTSHVLSQMPDASFGSIRFGTDVIPFPDKLSQLIIDDHKGYYCFPLFRLGNWNGTDAEGKMVGFNCTDNSLIMRNNENCLW